MSIFALILIILAFVLFIVAAFTAVPRVNLIAIGLAVLTLGAFIIPAIPAG